MIRKNHWLQTSILADRIVADHYPLTFMSDSSSNKSSPADKSKIR